MPDLVSELQLRFGVTAAEPTFALEVDDRDAILNEPIRVVPFYVVNWYWTREQIAAYYDGQEILKVLSNGVQHVRLYTPDDAEVDIVATEPPVALKGVDRISFNATTAGESANVLASEYNRSLFSLRDVTKVPGVTLTNIQAPRPAPPTFEYVGRKTDIVIDTIKFSNARVAFQKYTYARGGFQLAYASRFVTTDGRTIDRPQWIPELGGAFVLKEPATGVLVVRYLVSYRLYRIRYGMAGGVEFPDVQAAWLQGDIRKFPMPPVTVMAIAPTAGLVAETEFEKAVDPPGAGLVTWSSKSYEEAQQDAGSVTLTEARRATDTVRVFSPDDSEVFVDVRRAREITLYDAKGSPHTYRLNP